MVKQSFPAEPVAASVARRVAGDFAASEGAHPETVAAIQLCVSEAVANVVVHAYRDTTSGRIELEACRPDGFLCLYVRDEGCGMSPRTDSPGLGLGLPLISQAAAALEVRAPSGGGTELVMRFDL